MNVNNRDIFNVVMIVVSSNKFGLISQIGGNHSVISHIEGMIKKMRGEDLRGR
jgi:hypothetical protein